MRERETRTVGVHHIPGFTLVEILVVLAIIGVIVVVSMEGIRRYGQTQQYREFVSEVTNGVTEARSKSLAAIDDLTYGVYIGTSTIEYFSGSVPTVGNPANTIINIPTYVSATSSFSSPVSYMTFAQRTGVPSVTGDITLVDLRSPATSTITIYASGLVE